MFFTGLNLLGFQVGAVHSELDLSLGEETAEGYEDQSLEALIVRARKQAPQHRRRETCEPDRGERWILDYIYH